MTAKEISDRILKGTDDDPVSPGSVKPGAAGGVPNEILAYINAGQELFAFITLCLEKTTTLTLITAVTFPVIPFPDYICTLRLSVAGVRVRPETLTGLDAQSESWESAAGPPRSYAALGFGFWAITPQPTIDTTASLIYARSPIPLVGDAFPEIPEQYHQSLVKYGKYRVKLKEGGQGLQRGLVSLGEFMDDAMAHADYVRAKSRAAGYDTQPIESKLFDRSSLKRTAKS